MTPSVDERLASVVRALTDVILPSLPPEAGLAQEQVQLCIGHLQIMRAQLDATPAYEAEELVDAIALGVALCGVCKGGARTAGALVKLDTALVAARSPDGPAGIRQARVAINGAITALVAAITADGDEWSRKSLPRTILEHETRRVDKDRRWFAPFGFDSIPATA